jgi:membrane-associated protease RseP (regulator of RpoE activity)
LPETNQPTYYNITSGDSPVIQTPKKRKGLGIWLNIILFILTVFSTLIAGVQFAERDPYNIANLPLGLTYSILIITFLTFHEFGHYFAAKIHKVSVTLPYYIPFPFLFLNFFGTMGAVIRMKQQIVSRKALFDIGIAGPVAGFAAATAMLIYGMMNLPPFEYIYNIHPEYAITGVPTTGLSFGPNLLYLALAKLLTSSPDVFLPPMNEMYHYPFLCVGWFGLLVTGLNLLPVGQLDGGHIIYALFKGKSRYIARTFFGIILGLGILGLPSVIDSIFIEYFGMQGIFNFTWLDGYGLFNWFIWAILIFFVIKIEHPPFYDPEPLGTGRKLWGVFALFMFVSSFTPVIITSF